MAGPESGRGRDLRRAGLLRSSLRGGRSPTRQSPAGIAPSRAGATVLGCRLLLEMVADDGVEGHRDFSHAGDERDLAGFSVVAEPPVEGFDGGVVADGAQGGDVEDVADADAAASDGTVAAPGAAVAVDGRDADEGGGLVAGQTAELAHVGDQGVGEDGPDALVGGEAGEERLLGAIAIDDG